ncbi:hypothetical protein LWI29_026265 [Acer saccharum]|uniref:SWIM-type domain-containing protein n=1 Tax=Acer saccharum TaxID=4024 RepID=A0AA39T653_ACESA|nr:hypothetical protein LWI29_026265 [Acer saccharum]
MLGRYGKNKVLKDIFRKAVKVYRVNQFDRCIDQLRNINSGATMYVTDVGFERWSRAYSPRKRYNLMSSNIAEAMNNAIKDCRELPITRVIDYIREVLQHWFHDRRTSAGKLMSTLTTKDGDLDGIVDLTSKTCTCRQFDIDEIPCEHALACIRVQRFSYVDYCSPYYSSAFLAAAYSGEIHPVGHPPEWLVPEDIASIVVFPPVRRRLPGRPKKNRTPSFGAEVSQSTCTTCHRNGHNSHTCTYSRSSKPSTNTSGVGEASGLQNV